jgi:predicted dienelactone hydrolase
MRVVVGLVLVSSSLVSAGTFDCLRTSGAVATRCLADYTEAIARCRKRGDAACEVALRGPGGQLEATLDRPEPLVQQACVAPDAEPLGYLNTDDVVLRGRESCEDFGEDLTDLAFGPGIGSAASAFVPCRRELSNQLARLRSVTIRLTGKVCVLDGYRGDPCDRSVRDARIGAARTRARQRILQRCAGRMDQTALDGLLDTVARHARHYSQRVYPPNDLGPTAEFGPYAVGIRTLQLVDPSRTAVGGVGPRPLTVEVYYPATPAEVAGHPRDVVQVLGVPIIATPSYRDVPRAPGRFPLVMFSHGNNGLRIQSFFFGAHLASHGYVVVSPDHHGNTFVDTLAGIVDPDPATNRPLDMHVLLDQVLAFDAEPGNFLEGAIDADRIGASGHSFGGFTAFLLAGGDSGFGTFADPRVKAILPQAPAAPFPPAFFAAVHVPTLVLGGSIDETTPFDENQQRPFDLLPSGASVVALGRLHDAGHFTFSDFCEVPRTLLGFLGGFSEACEPRHLPWRHAHDIVNYLALNFFDATLRGDVDALARLDAAALARIEDLDVQRK